VIAGHARPEQEAPPQNHFGKYLSRVFGAGVADFSGLFVHQLPMIRRSWDPTMEGWSWQEEVGCSAVSVFLFSLPLQIGSITTGSCNVSTHQLSGFVDEVRLYDFALAMEQIQSIYERKRKIFMTEP
jgi:hypothetical protein